MCSEPKVSGLHPNKIFSSKYQQKDYDRVHASIKML